MNNRTEIVPATDIAPLIRSIRDQRVILDSDLAAIYGVETKSLNRAVKRNAHRFPLEFVFMLRPEEAAALRCQFGTLKPGRGRHPKYPPYAFSEHPEDWPKRVATLKAIDWRRTNREWQGVAMSGSDVANRRQSRMDTASFLKRRLGLTLTPGEEKSLKGAQAVMDELKQLIASN